MLSEKPTLYNSQRSEESSLSSLMLVTSSKRDNVVLKMNWLQKIDSNLKMPSDVLLTKKWSYTD